MVSGRSEPIEKRFWRKVDRGDDDECWEWQACTDEMWGYGRISGDAAHRVAYRLEVEEPGDDFVLHHCDNPACVNPSHLYLGDQQDNMNDAVERDRMAKGEDHGMTSLTEDEVSHIKWKLENGDETWEDLSEMYGVTERTIGNIRSGSTWEHVDAERP